MGKTSSAVKDRYNAKAYDSICVRVPKDMAKAFRAKCTTHGTPIAQVIKSAIQSYLDSTYL